MGRGFQAVGRVGRDRDDLEAHRGEKGGLVLEFGERLLSKAGPIALVKDQDCGLVRNGLSEVEWPVGRRQDLRRRRLADRQGHNLVGGFGEGWRRIQPHGQAKCGDENEGNEKVAGYFHKFEMWDGALQSSPP